MWNKIPLYLKNFDWVLFFSVVLLILFGMAEIYSVALSKEGASLLSFKKQILFFGVGLCALFFLAFIDYHNLRSFSMYLYIIGAAFLLAVLFFGQEIKGTKGWFGVGGFGIQPVELVKFVLIVFLARYFSSVSVKLNPFKHLLLSGFGCGFLIFLVMRQPDFGSAMILFTIWAIMIVLSGFKKKYIFLISILLASIFVAGWLFFFKDYQKNRIRTLFSSEENSLDEGYNVRQATIAVGSGGLIGRGIGFGSQSQLKFLPESQTDFIFAVIAEELGFLGVTFVLGLFSLFFYRVLVAIRTTNNDFGVYFLLGSSILIFIEMFINIGMNIGIVPVVGIALPFISYGGSAIVSHMMMVGAMESIIIRSKIKY